MAFDAPRASGRELVRTVFLSDFHLGARSAQTDRILRFLRRFQAEKIYLVGDIFDIWHGGKVHWDDTHDAIIMELVGHAERGAEVIYLTGNHDAMLRRAEQSPIRQWTMAETAIHHSADGRRYLVVHGDQCDPRMLRWHFMTRFGSRVDGTARAANDLLRRIRNLPEAQRTFLEWGIDRVHSFLAMGPRFEARVTELARAHGCDGVVCGHSHQPALRESQGFLFANCGDWVDSQTGLVELSNGTMRLLNEAEEPAPAIAAARPEPLSEGSIWKASS
ncbi:UDP-2,3-diacylglucosamine diphosphatase [Pseudooceanicola sp. CBS1P-1]|uniref:UDP-2,3-diacylglucosamine diphosphatase n=1 Tax=Pseudooceanicola albus TaxID=2692189 RepID=A0A6L7G6Z1_9RHOB|nr:MULTISPECIES: UDP-2,3-diacylglucosamine diphosphatase [Pseudooceanicola]MBT9382978.1 UDP-2,3-diacylglucosamine diphosphatase [Pseudooceanicola endophyticus]MXN19166.1 UDP-2,3-diacylglucosamine diphosphatase [Pseudooceanicola albus]